MNNRTLGTIATICAPAMLLVGGPLAQENPVVTGVMGSVFMFGWICANTAMRRTHAAGTGKWGRAVLLIQLVGLVLAFAFGIFEATGLLEGTVVFNITDAAWPLSMLWMLVVGVTVVAAKRLPGWKRFVPVLCPFWLPIAIAGTGALGGAGDLIGAGYAAVLWGLLGYAVRGEERVDATPEPAVR